jgi:hypothetical protein
LVGGHGFLGADKKNGKRDLDLLPLPSGLLGGRTIGTSRKQKSYKIKLYLNLTILDKKW